MTHPAYLKEKARQMRVQDRLTIDELAERLGLSRTTVFHWVRDLPIPTTKKQSAAQRRAADANRRRAQAKRDAAYRLGEEEFPALSDEPTFRDFVCMYIGEGHKKSRNTVAICNSDPAVVKLGNDWLDRLTAKGLSYAVQYHVDQDVEELREFWGVHLGIDPGRVRLQRKSNSNQMKGRKWRSRYGVLTVSVCDTMLRSRLQAWIGRVTDDWL